jgi:hypothetical protein
MEMRKAYKILVEAPQEKVPVGRTGMNGRPGTDFK